MPDVGVVEVVGGDEQARGVLVGAVFGAGVVPPMPGGGVAVVGVPELVGEGGFVLDDAHAAAGGDGTGGVVVPPLRPARVACELYA